MNPGLETIRRRQLWLGIALGVGVVLTIAAGFHFLAGMVVDHEGLLNSPSEWAIRGQFGDQFGAVNAVFSGLALAAVAVSVFLQSDELRKQREELELQRQVHIESVELRREELDFQKRKEAADRRPMWNVVTVRRDEHGLSIVLQNVGATVGGVVVHGSKDDHPSRRRWQQLYGHASLLRTDDKIDIAIPDKDIEDSIHDYIPMFIQYTDTIDDLWVHDSGVYKESNVLRWSDRVRKRDRFRTFYQQEQDNLRELLESWGFARREE